MIKRTFLSPFLLWSAVFSFAMMPFAQAEAVRVEGSPHSINIYVSPKQDYLEDVAQAQLVVKKSTTIDAFQSLVDGKTDIAFIVGNFRTLFPFLKKQLPQIKAEDYSVFILPEQKDLADTSEVVGYFRCSVVVAASNPVKSLTLDQVRDIFSGKITNWNKVGGKDMPIRVVTEPRNTMSRFLIEEKFMKGVAITSNAKEIDGVTWSAPPKISAGDIGVVSLIPLPPKPFEATKNTAQATATPSASGIVNLAPPADGAMSGPPKPVTQQMVLAQSATADTMPPTGSLSVVKPILLPNTPLILPIEVVVKGRPSEAVVRLISLMQGQPLP